MKLILKQQAQEKTLELQLKLHRWSKEGTEKFSRCYNLLNFSPKTHLLDKMESALQRSRPKRSKTRWRARCGETRTPGSESSRWKQTLIGGYCATC